MTTHHCMNDADVLDGSLIAHPTTLVSEIALHPPGYIAGQYKFVQVTQVFGSEDIGSDVIREKVVEEKIPLQ